MARKRSRLSSGSTSGSEHSVGRTAAAPSGSLGDTPETSPLGHNASPKEDLVRQALEQGDRRTLERLAFAEHGFCSAHLRRAVWLYLLGLTPGDVVDTSWRRFLGKLNGDTNTARVIEADVQRSVYSWDVHTNINEKTRDKKRVQMSEVMHAILRRHCERLAYFQGFHDIVLVFVEVGTPSHAYHMVERLALFHVSDQLCHPLDRGLLPLLGVLYHLVGMLDPPLALALYQADCAEMHFAVPWVLTWFAHSLPRLHDQVMRLFDCLLSSHPSTILYFCAALLIQHRTAILETPREMPEMVAVIQGISWGSIDVDAWAKDTEALMRQVTPNWLLWRLRQYTERLPSTTPLLNYPHPWMDPHMPLFFDGDVLRLAPVYKPPTVHSSGVSVLRALLEVPVMLWHTGGKLASRAFGLSWRGGLLVTVLAMLSKVARRFLDTT